MTSIRFLIRKIMAYDRDWTLKVTRKAWGADFVVIHGQIYYPCQLAGFIAEDGEGKRVGLITLIADGEQLEIITLNSVKRGAGIGTALIEAVEKEARSREAARICVTTTNDNQGAIDFYQHRGFQLAGVRHGAADQARKIKPSIPLSAVDELDFVLSLV